MRATQQLARAIERRFNGGQDLPLAVGVTPGAVRDHLRTHYEFSEPRPLADVFADADRMLREWTEHASHPMHFGLFRPNVDEASVLADALVALYDPNLATWAFSPAANELERHTLSAILDRFGVDAEAWAMHFTSGGQEANHTAVIVALTHQFSEVGRDGLRALPAQPVFYLSEEGHHSFEKVAHSTGLGRRALRTVPAGSDLRLDMEALWEQIRADRRAGLAPFMIVATSGTTNAGIIDPLNELADVARQEGLWFHVDGAWGASAALSDRLRPVLEGITRADSITCDAHKLMSVPVGAGMFFCRHPDTVRTAFEVDTPYVAAGRTDPYVSSLQWSRRFIGLKVFMMLDTRGMPEIARRIEHQTAMGDRLREGLSRLGWRVLNSTLLPVVCFSHDDLDGHPERASEIATRLRRTNEAWISKTDLRGRLRVLRACVANFDTQAEHVDRLLNLLERERMRFVD